MNYNKQMTTIHDLLHKAERATRRDGITDNNYMVNTKLSHLGFSHDDPSAADDNSAAAKRSRELVSATVNKFTVAVYNTSDIKIDRRLEVDTVYLHDVHQNLAYVFRNVRPGESNFLIGMKAKETIDRAKELRMSLATEVVLDGAPQLRGNALQRVLRLGRDYLTVLDMFYTLNAISVSNGTDTKKLMTALFPAADSAEKKTNVIEGLLSLAKLIPVDAISQAVQVNNLLTGTMTVTGEIGDEVIEYANAIRLNMARM